MNLEQHISYLLYRYNCVVIPNFGAFLTEKISGSIQESNHTFYPPKKIVSFNSHIKNNDGLLANHITQFEDCSYDEAVSKIEGQVSIWKKNLLNSDFLILKNIGLLKLNTENNIVFETYENTNYLTDSFGLSSFVSPTVKREVLKAITNEKETFVENDENKVIHLEAENRFSARGVLKYTAAVVVFLSAGAFGYINYINQQEQTETLLVQKEVQKEVQSKIQEATFLINNPTLTPEVIKNRRTPFYLISGAYRNEKNAKNACVILLRKGYIAQILEKNEHELFPVTYGCFSSYPEAQEKLKEIQATENKDAWLFIRE